MTEISAVPLGMHILEVEITTRCNLDCRHCYNRNRQSVDLPLATIESLVDFARRHQVWTFTLSGGEALLHPQFDDLIKFLADTKKEFRLVLQSNGTLLFQPEIRRKLAVFDLIHLSCDLAADVRESGKDNFELAKILQVEGLNCYLFNTLHRGNRHMIDQMVEASDRSGVPIGFNICIPVDRLPQGLAMTREEFWQTERQLYELYRAGRILRYSSPLTALLDPEKAGPYQGIRGGCSAGVAACVVEPSGEVLPCPFFRLSAGNIFKTPLEEIWNEAPIFMAMRQRRSFQEPCGSCEFLSFCGGCRNRAYKATGDLKGNDPMCYRDLQFQNERLT